MPNVSLCVQENDVHYNPKPYDVEVEYLESGGMANPCFIDTGFIPNNTTRVVVRIKDYQELGRWIFGARRGFSDRSYGIYTATEDGTSGFQFGTNHITIGNANILLNNRSLTIDFNGAARTCTITNEYGAIVSTAMGGVVFSAPCPLAIFALNNNGSKIAFTKLKMYDALIYDSDVIVRDFIPVRIGTTGYMYDKVSGKLFGNSGTGEFILGPDKK